MKYRNVQKTGNMHYVYLPTKWCNQKGISTGSRLEVDVDSSGNLVLSTKAKTGLDRNIKLKVDEADFEIISKVVMACFLNPVSSFEIELSKKLDSKELLKQKKILSTAMIELDGDRIYSEPIITIDNPLSVFLIMVNKSKNLVRLMIDDYDAELIQRYEEEIDWSNVMISKAIISSFMHKRDAKRKLIELHYLGLLSNYLERAVDHIILIDKIDKKEKRFLQEIFNIIEALYIISKSVQEKDSGVGHKEAMDLMSMVQNLKVNDEVVREHLIKKSLRYCSEVLIDWSVTSRVLE